MAETHEFTLRAMAENYGERHQWDHLDRDACAGAADEIKGLKARCRFFAGTIDRFKDWHARRAAADRAKVIDEIAAWHEKEAERYAGMGRRYEKKREWHAFSADVIRSTWRTPAR